MMRVASCGVRGAGNPEGLRGNAGSVLRGLRGFARTLNYDFNFSPESDKNKKSRNDSGIFCG